MNGLVAAAAAGDEYCVLIGLRKRRCLLSSSCFVLGGNIEFLLLLFLWKRNINLSFFNCRFIANVWLHVHYCVAGICAVFLQPTSRLQCFLAGWLCYCSRAVFEPLPLAFAGLQSGARQKVAWKPCAAMTKCLLANRNWRSPCWFFFLRRRCQVWTAVWRWATTPVVAFIVAFFMSTLICRAAFFSSQH